MKKNLRHHLVWALIALTTFVLGSKFTHSPPLASSDSPTGSPAPLSNRTLPSSESSEKNRRANSSRSPQSKTSSTASPEALTEADISELGMTFKNGNLIERRLAFAEMLRNLTPENARLMREQIADLPQDSAEFREFHYAWGSIAGQEAIDHGKDTPKRDMAASLAGWASQDPASAMAYFDSLSPEAQSNGALMKWGAIFGLADADPQLAAEFATERSQAGDKDASKMISVAASAVLKTGDREVATDWANKIPEGDLQNTAFQRLAGEYAKENPSEAVEWAVDLPDGEGKNHAIGSSFHEWAGRNPEEAAAAIASMPATDRDAATYGYATRVVHKDPAIGVEWASTISDQQSRTSALIDTGRVFYKRDQAAASEWLATSGLTPDQQQKITSGK